MRIKIIALVAAGSLVLAGCGSSTGDRAASGAGIGAAAGTAVGIVTGLPILAGVAIGAAAGGILGGVTTKDTIDFGEPLWASADRDANKAAVARVQLGLDKLGYDAGKADGFQGNQTTNAIRRYQADHSLTVDGRATEALAKHIDAQIQLAQKN